MYASHDLPIRFFRTIQYYLNGKIVWANQVTSFCIRLAFAYNYTLCLSRLPLCFSVVNFSDNREKDRAVRGKEIKNSFGTNNVSARQRRAKFYYFTKADKDIILAELEVGLIFLSYLTFFVLFLFSIDYFLKLLLL